MHRLDLHRHVWPPELIAALASRHMAPYLRGERLTTCEGTFSVDLAAQSVEGCLAELDECGVNVAVASLQPTLGLDALPRSEAEELSAAYDAGIARAVADSGGRLRAFSAGPPRAGFVGTCVSAATLLDGSRIASMADRLVELEQVLFVHPGPAAPSIKRASWWAAAFDYTAQMQAAYGAWLAHGAERWPTLPVVFAILAGGAPFQIERLHSRGVDTRSAVNANTYFDTASYGRLALELSLATFGVTRLVYGSDAPVIDPGATLSAVRALGNATADAICSRNPSALLAA